MQHSPRRYALWLGFLDSLPHPVFNTFTLNLNKHICFNLPACCRVHFNTPVAWNHTLPENYDVMCWWHDRITTQLSLYTLIKKKDFSETKDMTRREWTWHHSPNTWIAAELSHMTQVFFRPTAMQIRLAHVATTYLSMESTICSMHPLILFCASKWVMFSVGSPSMAKIMSPIHRLAWAALLPGVTFNTGDVTDIKNKTATFWDMCEFGLHSFKGCLTKVYLSILIKN